MQFVRTRSAAALFLLLGTAVPAYAQRDQQDEKQGKPEKQQGGREQGGTPSAQHQRPQAQSQQQNQRQERRGQPAQPPQQQRAQQPQPQQQQRAQQPERQQQQQRAQQPQQQQRAQQPERQQQQQQRAQHPQQQQASRTRQQAVAWQQKRGWVQQGAWQGHTTWQQNRAQQWGSQHRTWAQRGGYGGYYIPQYTFGINFGRQHWFRIRSMPTMYMGYPRFEYGGYSFLLVDPYPEYWADDWYRTDDVYIDYDDGYYLYNRSYPDVRLAITVSM